MFTYQKCRSQMSLMAFSMQNAGPDSGNIRWFIAVFCRHSTFYISADSCENGKRGRKQPFH